ncbi:hypothetical protein CKF54_04425 [Psittacicella hinzii]|uniref:Uncharacterized protein n=1 Tax=Psittacicella hinzii TaxID=2028575 RepID=A0A3A1Y548_9GAMM|nr:hypothetical protein [Psittacicella hinzii]RIY32705.1 hypothetical protein CKF54_04425 [Psittacicella hinzii]
MLKRAFMVACLALALVGCGKSDPEPQVTNTYTENLDFTHQLYPSVQIDPSFYQGNIYFSEDFDFNKVVIESLLRMVAEERYGITTELPASVKPDPLSELFTQTSPSNPLLSAQEGEDQFLYSLRRTSYVSSYSLIGIRYMGSMLRVYADQYANATPENKLEIFRALNLYFDYIMAEYRYLYDHTTFNWQELMEQNGVSINFNTANFAEYLQQYNTKCQIGSFDLDLDYIQKGVGALNEYYTNDLKDVSKLLLQSCQMVNSFLEIASLNNYKDIAPAFNAVAVAIAQSNIAQQHSQNVLGLNLVNYFKGPALNAALISISVSGNSRVIDNYTNYVSRTLAIPEATNILATPSETN